MYNFQHKSKPFSFTRLLSPYLDVTGINYSSCDLFFFLFFLPRFYCIVVITVIILIKEL